MAAINDMIRSNVIRLRYHQPAALIADMAKGGLILIVGLDIDVTDVFMAQVTPDNLYDISH
jgi:hypothetical protein